MMFDADAQNGIICIDSYIFDYRSGFYFIVSKINSEAELVPELEEIWQCNPRLIDITPLKELGRTSAVLSFFEYDFTSKTVIFFNQDQTRNYYKLSPEFQSYRPENKIFKTIQFLESEYYKTCDPELKLILREEIASLKENL